MADEAKKVQLVRILSESMGVELSADAFKGYAFALDDVPVEFVQKAVEVALRGDGGTAGFIPKPPELRRLALDAQAGGRRLAAPYHRQVPAGGQIGGFLVEGDTRTQEQREREQTEAAKAREGFGRVVGRIGKAMP